MRCGQYLIICRWRAAVSADTIVVQHNDGNPSILSLSLFLCPSVSLNISAACIAFLLSSRAEMRNMIPVYLNLV